MSIPCDILLKALTPQRACAGAPNDRRRPSGLYWYTNPHPSKGSGHIFSSQFHTEQATAGQMSDACKLGSLNDVFASCPATNSKNLGGGGRDRTDDPLLAKQVLSQLSYAPVRYSKQSFARPTGRRGSCRVLAQHSPIGRTCESGKEYGGPGRT